MGWNTKRNVTRMVILFSRRYSKERMKSKPAYGIISMNLKWICFNPSISPWKLQKDTKMISTSTLDGRCQELQLMVSGYGMYLKQKYSALPSSVDLTEIHKMTMALMPLLPVLVLLRDLLRIPKSMVV